MKITDKEKQLSIQRICKSKTFKNAPTSISLLQYLHRATQEGIALKEMVIDIDFFGKKELSDKSNPRVRVNVYNLRKKLKQYYEEEGKQDKWQVSIEKGQYQVSFTKRESSFKHFQQHFLIQALPYIALLIALCFILFTNIAPRPQALWKDLLSSKQHTNLYIGDAFGLVGTTITGRRGFTRDYSINSFSDFYEMINTREDLKDTLSPSTFTYATSMAVISTQRFQEFFQKHKRSFAIRFATRTSASEIKEGNAIYIGSLRNKSPFIAFFNDANPYFDFHNRRLFFTGHPELEDCTYDIFSFDELNEYALVSKYRATDNTEHLVFFSEHDIGVSATVDYFTNNDSIKSFTKKHLKHHKYFTALFKVKGQDRTDTNIQLETVVAF